jgi:hypothetical protein
MDPTESADVLRTYHAQQDYPWTGAVGNRPTIEAYNVISTSIKFAMDRNGIVVSRRGYGVGSEQSWRDLLRSLASS